MNSVIGSLCRIFVGSHVTLNQGPLALKVLPSSHSTATWCVMVNVSMWCLPILLPIRSGVLDITIGMIKKVIHFNGKTLHFPT